MSKRWALAIGVLCITGLTVAEGGTATARAKVDGPRTAAAQAPQTIHEQTPEEARAQDFAATAKAFGWTVEQAAAQHAVSEAVGAVAEAVANAHRDVFVGSRLSDDPGGAPTLYVKGPASPAVKALVAQAGIPVDLADNQPFSFDELEARKGEVTNTLKAQGYRSFTTGFRLGGRGVVHAAVERTPGLPADAFGVTAQLPEALRNRVAVTVRDGAVAKREAAYGGLWITDNGMEQCTSGWSVYKTTTGTTGVSTAAHCNAGGDTPDEIIDPGVDVYPWNLAGRHIGRADVTTPTWGDIEWGTTPAIEPAVFSTSQMSTRRVTAVEPYSQISEADTVCGYGRSSNREACDKVMDLSQDCYVYNSGGEVATKQVRVRGNNFIGGDSGGPKYYLNKAFGSHFGQCDGADAFSVADYYDEALSVRVRLSQTLATRVTLSATDRLVSTDGRFTAIMQPDGNFVIYRNGGGALWSTHTNGSTNARLVMQSDGNLVVRRRDNTAAWASNTGGTGLYLTMQTDGNLVMYGSGGAYWSSGTCCH